MFSFGRPTHWKNNIWLESLVSEQTVEYQSVYMGKTHATIATPQNDKCKNKQEFSEFWAISYCFEQIIMLIRNAFYFINHNSIAVCLRGARLNNFEKGQPPPPLLHVPALICTFSIQLGAMQPI